ncbi:uncharacterized protein CC84DRAFT_1251913 [Paraphaeosphaeria sporulosa]|uniref:BTB domain-containing protein n=1 Tax=Paraphaeosphaeria sporulosa TaxID=1460663 RepID=A0A177C5I9_9PLEO|nr:uncharacterized protein CC84DRAFT_1251913 [Paraphaeosphaeria sporulosa]OAG01950.1 hypothetical protein CC84DRAFT_1251913 [Paraphaeosphaeria sporulosa]
MQLFKALGRGLKSTLESIASPLKYLGTTRSVGREGITHDLDFTIDLVDLPDLWTFLATHDVEAPARDFFYALDFTELMHRWDIIPMLNRTMATSTRPILPYTMYPHAPGLPVRFLVGLAQMPFDIHTNILVDDSPRFTPAFLARLTAPLALPNMTPEAFGALTKWLYTRDPPIFSCASELQHLCELWVAAAQLGIYLKANTLLRLGMELMTPGDRVADFGTARWVFSNTPAGSPLRGFVIVILAQRSQPNFAAPFQAGDVEIWKARTAFMGKLQHARKVLAFGTRNADGRVTLDFEKEKREGMGVGLGKLPMPAFLVWDEKVWNDRGQVVPDRFFVFPETEEFHEGLVGWLKAE